MNRKDLITCVRMLLAAEKWKAAEQLLKKEEHGEPDAEICHLRLQAAQHLQPAEKVLEMAESFHFRFPSDTMLLLDAARAAVSAGDSAKALALLTRFEKDPSKSHSEKGMISLRKAQILASESLYSDAGESTARAMIEGREDELTVNQAIYLKMNLCLQENRMDEALSCAIRLSHLPEGNRFREVGLFYLPFCLHRLGKKDEAMQGFAEAEQEYRIRSERNPKEVGLLLYRVMCLKELGRYDLALQLLSVVELAVPDLAEIHLLRSSVYEAQGRRGLAEEERVRAFWQRPDWLEDESIP